MTGLSQDNLSLPQHTHVSDPNEPHKADLLEQFYLTLRVTYMAAPQVPGSAVHARIEQLFTEVPTWRNAYEIEQLLCHVLGPRQLETELNRRLAEATALKLDYVSVIDKELHPDVNPSVDKRIVLHRLLNDLQWFYSKQVQHRSASERLMVRVSSLFMVALATFSLVLFIQFFAHGPGTATAAAASTAANRNTPGQQNSRAGAGAERPANQPPPGPATTTGGAASDAATNPAPTTQTTMNQSALGEPNTSGGVK